MEPEQGERQLHLHLLNRFAWLTLAIFISLFILSILLAIYLSALKANLWMLFLIMIPVEVLMYFCFKLYFDKKKRAESSEESKTPTESE